MSADLSTLVPDPPFQTRQLPGQPVEHSAYRRDTTSTTTVTAISSTVTAARRERDLSLPARERGQRAGQLQGDGHARAIARTDSTSGRLEAMRSQPPDPPAYSSPDRVPR